MTSYLFTVLMVGHIGHPKDRGYMCQAKSCKKYEDCKLKAGCQDFRCSNYKKAEGKEEEANYKYNPNGRVSNLSQAIGYWL